MTAQNTSIDRRPPGSTPPIAPTVYASRVPSRSPNWKVHTTLGRAHAAVAWSPYSGARGGEVWKLVEGEWKLLDTVESGTSADALPWHAGTSAR
ncbi:hypothetical protein ALI22I_34120 [Saccharothrix sp. ALI-22-I]|uniref:hypothetical protein n=1 Tax=Saccharothrix sp. ALI-22-I TaxID=1933778 RepID=UPI00097BDDE7|nr:hypothetical protein [Saccharothrix sp. ALI-22-I]ONI83529.1 hypothetical protein ALI22I_34120 [Saccharothrix sp. ALI-22-I]